MKKLLLLAVLISGPAAAQGVKFETMQLARVDIQREGATCSGQAVYRFEVKAAALKSDLGTASRALPLVVPCARLDDLLTYKSAPNTRSGAYAFTLDRVEFYLRADGTVAIDAYFLRSPTDADILAVYGTERVVVQYANNAAGRITNAIVGAQVVKGSPAIAAWPSSLVALPIPVQP